MSGNVSDANSTINGTSGSWAFRPLSAGDLNNDNYGDLVVGAGAGGTNLGGQAAVLFGGPNGIEEISISDANVTFNGSSYLDYLGYGWINLAVGDMNNDGVDDFVGGSYGAGPNGAQSGQAYVFFGPFTQGQSFNATLDANLTFNGSSAGDWFGEAFAIGDFDNNGNNDLGIGAKNADENGANAGQAYIFLGPFVQGQSFNATIAANATINGSAGSDNLGLPLVADDFNNDTYDDFVVVAKSADGDSSNVGQAYLFLGGPNGIHSGNATQHANLTLSGLESGYGLSFSGTSGNFNNDSYPELALGCDSADIVDSNAGQTLVYDFAPYLKDITIDIGNDADNEWTGSGRFSTVQNVSDFISEVNDYLDTCTAVNNNCTVPISISAGSAGQVSFDQLEVVYDYLDRSTLPKTLTGWKRIWIPDPNFPNNFTVEIVLQAINGSVSNIFFSDYLPSGATVYTDNVTYWNSTGKGTYNLTNSSDYFKTWEGLVSLPDGTIADVYIYNFTGSSTLWEGQLFANDTLNVTYNVSVLGGGSWKLPTLIFGLDPATGEMISVPLGDEVAIPLFDVFVDVQNKVVEVGDVVVGMVKMLNVGGPLVQVDMSLTSYISDPEGNVMDKSNEMVAVYRKQEKTVLMQVPEDAQAGKYLFHTVGVYSGQMVATSSDIFEVKRAINDFANIKENSNLILMFGMLMIILMLARSKTVIVKEVIREESVKDAKSKKPK